MRKLIAANFCKKKKKSTNDLVKYVVSYSKVIYFLQPTCWFFLNLIFKIGMHITSCEGFTEFRQIRQTNIRRKTSYFDPCHKYFFSSVMIRELLHNWKVCHRHITSFVTFNDCSLLKYNACFPIERLQCFGGTYCLHLQAKMHHIADYHTLMRH
jgi:hypothetical protein